jgi:predicted acylesterase/phospholipase RssA
MEQRLSQLSTASLFALGWSLHARLSGRAGKSAAARLRDDLEALRRLSLDRLHFGIRQLGLLALDLFSGEEVFAATGSGHPLAPWDVAVGGASIPGLFPWVRCQTAGRTYHLVDGGFSHAVPVERALQPPFLARKVLAVDLGVIRGFRERDPLRWEKLESEHPGRVIRLRPRVDDAGTIFFRAAQAPDLVRRGEEAVLEQAPALC